MTSKLPSWETTKTQSKKGFDKAWDWMGKLGAPVNRLSNRIGSEAFWPTSMDKESDKAARILQSFCKDGFYAEEEKTGEPAGPSSKTKQRVIKKIPQKVIENAVGLAIFTTMRTGLWLSGAGGSGVLVARQEDGSWSPPSGILLHTAGLGFLVGVDIYDCVLVINNRKALSSFTKLRATVGGEISAVAGPVGVGALLENDGKWKQANRPVFTYIKSRGFYAGVQMDGTIVIERTDENEIFYGERIGVNDILAGKARHPPPEIKMLMETLKAAEGRSDYDEKVIEELEGQPAPSDYLVEKSGHVFGVPEPDDPDPYGVMALHNEGLDIVTAGNRSRPSHEEFEYHPSPGSPAYAVFQKRSMDINSADREKHIPRAEQDEPEPEPESRKGSGAPPPLEKLFSSHPRLNSTDENAGGVKSRPDYARSVSSYSDIRLDDKDDDGLTPLDIWSDAPTGTDTKAPIKGPPPPLPPRGVPQTTS